MRTAIILGLTNQASGQILAGPWPASRVRRLWKQRGQTAPPAGLVGEQLWESDRGLVKRRAWIATPAAPAAAVVEQLGVPPSPLSPEDTADETAAPSVSAAPAVGAAAGPPAERGRTRPVRRGPPPRRR